MEVLIACFMVLSCLVGRWSFWVLGFCLFDSSTPGKEKRVG
jgi:hypothetical protein